VQGKPKRLKIEPVGKHLYPALQGEPEHATTRKRNIKLLNDELAKLKPNSANIKSLMTRTFLY